MYHMVAFSRVSWLFSLFLMPTWRASSNRKSNSLAWVGGGNSIRYWKVKFLSRHCDSVLLCRLSWIKCQLCCSAGSLREAGQKLIHLVEQCSEAGFFKEKAQFSARIKKENAKMLEQSPSVQGCQQGRETAFWNDMETGAQRTRGETFAFSCLPSAAELSPAISACLG